MPPGRFLATALLIAISPLPGKAQEATKRIFLPPPLQWDHDMLTSRPALRQTATDVSNLTGGIVFGMLPGEVNARLPDPYPGMTWSVMPQAPEFPGDVRYFWARMDAAGSLRLGLPDCAGNGSYLVFLFSTKGLFRLSYRLVPDKACPDVAAMAQDLFARYVTLGSELVVSQHYRTGSAQVVDVTDSTAGYLVPIRWRQSAN